MREKSTGEVWSLSEVVYESKWPLVIFALLSCVTLTGLLVVQQLWRGGEEVLSLPPLSSLSIPPSVQSLLPGLPPSVSMGLCNRGQMEVAVFLFVYPTQGNQ